MSSGPNYAGNGYRSNEYAFVAGDGVFARPIARAGKNGSRIHALSIGTSDAGANTVVFYVGRKRSDGNIDALTSVDGGGSSDTITRAAGSFVAQPADGWRVGHRMLALHNGSDTDEAFRNPSPDDFHAVLTAAVALTLTFATATVVTAAVASTTMELWHLFPIGFLATSITGGTATNAAKSGLDSTQMPWLDTAPDRYKILCPDTALFASVGTVMGAGESLEVCADLGDY